MRGKKRTKEERYELFSALESYLEMGFSLKKACSLADVPYSTMRDISSLYEPLRSYTTALQNKVNVTARATVIASIEKGNVNDAKGGSSGLTTLSLKYQRYTVARRKWSLTT